MATVIPFAAVYYNIEKIDDLADVIGPPYDVLSSEERDALYSKHDANFVRIMLNRDESDDSESNNTYTRAAGFLNKWMLDGTLIQDESPAFYLYQQIFTNPGDSKRYTRSGLVCGVKLEPYSAQVVLPHEETRNKAKEDRLKLMRATHANPEPIYGLFEDPHQSLTREFADVERHDEPILEATVDGDAHRLYRLDGEDVIDAIQVFFQNRQIWIADGHHRYETGLTYRDECRSANPGRKGPQPDDYLLMVLTSFTDPGIVVLPTHRQVKNVADSILTNLISTLEVYFTVQQTTKADLPILMKGNPAHGEHKFGLVTSTGVWSLALRDNSVMDSVGNGHCSAWKKLDVSVLQTLILDKTLGIPASKLATTADIGYTRDYEEAFTKVETGEWQLSFILNDPSAVEVRDVASAGDKMPPKSTFFYPKLWSGLFLRKL